MEHVRRIPFRRPSRIMLVDSQTLSRFGLAQLIAGDQGMEICREATGVTEALLAVDESRPDLVILDVALKDGSGLNLIEQIRRRWPEILILVLSMQAESLFADRAIQAGARGYIRKDQTKEIILDAIHNVLNGQIYLSEDMTERILQRRHHERDSVENSIIDVLSNRELEVFQLIGEGHTRSELARSLHLSVKTIETHQENIKRKFNLRSNQELICRAVEWLLEHRNNYHIPHVRHGQGNSQE